MWHAWTITDQTDQQGILSDTGVEEYTVDLMEGMGVGLELYVGIPKPKRYAGLSTGAFLGNSPYAVMSRLSYVVTEHTGPFKLRLRWRTA